MKQLTLRPVDLLVLLYLAVAERPVRTYADIGTGTGVALSAAHGSVARVRAARLMDHQDLVAHGPALESFVLHGARYAYPPTVGRPQRGVPTGVHVLDDVRDLALDPSGLHVWPTPRGTRFGTAIAPLHPSVPNVVADQPALYQALAAFDALRLGSARERALAGERLVASLRRERLLS